MTADAMEELAMKWTERFAISALCVGLMPFAGGALAAQAQASDPAAHELALEEVDAIADPIGSRSGLNWIVVAHVPDSTENSQTAAPEAEAVKNTNESVAVRGDTDTLYAEDLFSDETVAEKGLALEAGWNMRLAENDSPAQPSKR
jgi:hypothetical protein